jgi:Uma2 family endonuclease
MITVPHNPRISPEEYFEWEAKQEIRYEYINGEVFTIARGTIDHCAIVANLSRVRLRCQGRNF